MWYEGKGHGLPPAGPRRDVGVGRTGVGRVGTFNLPRRGRTRTVNHGDSSETK